MSDDALDQLMQLVLDGEATPDERARLERAMAERPEVAARFDDLKSVFEALGAVRMAEPPEDLTSDIERALEEEASEQRRPHAIELDEPIANGRGLLDGWMSALRHRPAPALGLALVSGAALGAVVVAAVTGILGVGANDPRVAAQMGPVPVAEVLAIDRRSMEAGGAKLAIDARRGASTLECELVVTATGPAEVEVAYDPARQRLVGLELPRPRDSRFLHEPGRLWFQPEGNARYLVRFAESGTSTELFRVTLKSKNVFVEEVIGTKPGGS
jgi:hypothetical protein